MHDMTRRESDALDDYLTTDPRDSWEEDDSPVYHTKDEQGVCHTCQSQVCIIHDPACVAAYCPGC